MKESSVCIREYYVMTHDIDRSATAKCHDVVATSFGHDTTIMETSKCLKMAIVPRCSRDRKKPARFAEFVPVPCKGRPPIAAAGAKTSDDFFRLHPKKRVLMSKAIRRNLDMTYLRNSISNCQDLNFDDLCREFRIAVKDRQGARAWVNAERRAYAENPRPNPALLVSTKRTCLFGSRLPARPRRQPAVPAIAIGPATT